MSSITPSPTREITERLFSYRERALTLQRLSDPVYDLLILGGGIVGAGIARDASLRGLKVCLLEKNDFAFGTSSRSSRLIHGGLRYLEQGHLRLVFEALRERRILARIAPHLCQPLAFFFPMYQSSRLKPWKIKLGLRLYQLLALCRSGTSFQYLNAQKAHEQNPVLKTEGLRAAAIYHDAFTNDARLTLENIKSAWREGATCLNYLSPLSCQQNGAEQPWVITFKDTLSGQIQNVAGRGVIQALGPWLDQWTAESCPSPSGLSSYLSLTKGIHVVVERKRLPIVQAIVLLSPQDERVMFAIPWEHHVILGTTDTVFQDLPETVCATAQDVAYVLETANHYFPQACLSPKDVISTWAGVRPLVKASTRHPSAIPREDCIIDHGHHRWSIVGGKLTTYRRMAQRILDRAVQNLSTSQKVKPCVTHRLRLDTHEVGASLPPSPPLEHHFSSEVVIHLRRTYGVQSLETMVHLIQQDPTLKTKLHPNHPYVLAEAYYAIHYECAMNLCDMFIRRLSLFHQDPDHGQHAIELHRAWLRQQWQWSEETFQKEWEQYQVAIRISEQFRLEYSS